MSIERNQTSYVAKVHWIVVLLAWTVFPLIWVGGLVTSYDAGMAVPDWPGTYGYNLFLYPIESWFYGPFDLFVEHGHRLLGALAGLLSIALVSAAYWFGSEKLVKRWAILVLGLVIFQGLLGGTRVVFDARTIALVHGCIGPVFFACVVAICVFTSKWWNGVFNTVGTMQSIGQFQYLSCLTLFVCIVQLVIGACMRHIGDTASPDYFRVLVLIHLAVAGLVLFLTAGQAAIALLRRGALVYLLRSSSILLCLVAVQIALGLSTWVVKFGYPVWFRNTELGESYLVQEKSLLQMNTITLHVACGSLIIATAAFVATKALRISYLQLRTRES